MMMDDYARKRIEGDYAYQSERLKNLFRAIYRDPVKAWAKWEAYVAARGFPTAEVKMARKPGYFGRQQGGLILNFWPTKAYLQREMAKRESPRVLQQWGAAHLQRAQSEERVAEAQEAEEQVRIQREADRDARAQSRLAAREKTSKERAR